MDKKRLIILADFGLDDACALAYILEYADRFEGIDIVCIAGNSPAKASLYNAQKLLLHYEGSTKGIRLIRTDDFPQNCAMLPSVHGKDGMGDLFPALSHVDATDYAEWVKTLPKDAIILSLGPCTVTVDILRRTSGYELILMAGLTKAKPNFKGMEFNQALDHASYRACLQRSHKVATLDTCRTRSFNLASRRFYGERMLYKLVNRANELAEIRHPDNSYIYDLITALYLIHPNFFQVRSITDPWGNELNELKCRDSSFSLAEYLQKH